MNLLPLDELNNLSDYLNANYSELTAEEIVDSVLDLLLLSYTNGVSYANTLLGTSEKPKIAQIQKSLSKTYENIGYEQRIKDYAKENDVNAIIKVADTESHRIFNEATMNTAKASGKDVYKTWVTMEDNKVRDAHIDLDGVKIPLDEKFYVGEASALYPGAFGVPELDINCRCILQLSTK